MPHKPATRGAVCVIVTTALLICMVFSAYGLRRTNEEAHQRCDALRTFVASSLTRAERYQRALAATGAGQPLRDSAALSLADLRTLGDHLPGC